MQLRRRHRNVGGGPAESLAKQREDVTGRAGTLVVVVVATLLVGGIFVGGNGVLVGRTASRRGIGWLVVAVRTAFFVPLFRNMSMVGRRDQHRCEQRNQSRDGDGRELQGWRMGAKRARFHRRGHAL